MQLHFVMWEEAELLYQRQQGYTLTVGILGVAQLVYILGNTGFLYPG